MKRLLYISLSLFFVVAILFANPHMVLADEGQDETHLELEVNGYHVTLASENDWAKGENTIVVTLADGMGMPLKNAEVAILIAPKVDEHAEAEADSHGAEPQSEHGSMAGMETDAATEEAPAHDEEIVDPIAMIEADEHGMYVAETHLEASGEHEVNVMFHVNGEMLQADFIVEIPRTGSKTIVLWSFVLINMALITSAGFMKKQTLSAKGTK